MRPVPTSLHVSPHVPVSISQSLCPHHAPHPHALEQCPVSLLTQLRMDKRPEPSSRAPWGQGCSPSFQRTSNTTRSSSKKMVKNAQTTKPWPGKSMGNLTSDFRAKGRIPEATFSFTQPLTRSEARRRSSTSFYQVPPCSSAAQVSSPPSAGVMSSGL